MESENVLDFAELIRTKSGVIVKASESGDLNEALDHIEDATDRMCSIL